MDDLLPPSLVRVVESLSSTPDYFKPLLPWRNTTWGRMEKSFVQASIRHELIDQLKLVSDAAPTKEPDYVSMTKLINYCDLGYELFEPLFRIVVQLLDCHRHSSAGNYTSVYISESSFPV
ncbi:hypothetical protein R1flu_006618 [Riccia fluitans]|uniref:Uncharacterized protein n=1 Tax=Riccia fluitans TaxID=41844 RepID=A0ABD1YZ83_9MARC